MRPIEPIVRSMAVGAYSGPPTPRMCRVLELQRKFGRNLHDLFTDYFVILVYGFDVLILKQHVRHAGEWARA